MSNAITHDDAARPMQAPIRSDLRARISRICYGLRIAAVLWALWILAMDIVVWADKTAVLEAYGRWLSADLSGVSDLRYMAAFAIVLVDWCGAVAIVFCLWRLVGTYLDGRVFAVDAALWLRRAGLTAIVVIVVDVLARLATASILISHLTLIPARGFFALPQDLLHLIFALFILALAHIFKAAAEMADDQAQIV